MKASCTVKCVSKTATADTVDPGLPPAPGAGQYPALDLANSAIVLPGDRFLDPLGTPSGANQWLVDHALAPADAGLQEICAARMRSLREQVRTLLAAQIGGHPAPAAALAAVNDALTRVPTASPLGWDSVRGMHRTAPHPIDQMVDQALGILAADAADLLTGPDAERLTACPSAPCNRYLLRAGRRHWCSVRCGDRARAARARRTQTITD
ncbi:ABATE domain-containing protein [Streptomyces lunaelactis]|nr:ABATE domain-containing protein [Streptomyces lunaelactis]NUK66708.1 ABATE domain-containing protein [Streptomyces lunaelactis]